MTPFLLLLGVTIAQIVSWNEATWSWLSGGNAASAHGSYGNKLVPSKNNFPGSRWKHSMVIHPSLKCLYVFGGEGYDALGNYSDPITLNYGSVKIVFCRLLE